MHATTFLLTTLSALAFVHANEGIESDDVPSQCLDRCRSVINLSDSCDDRSFSSNNEELQCICAGQNMATAIPDCEACVRPFWEGSDDDDYDETNNLLRRCALPAVGVTSSGSSTMMMSTTSTTSSAASSTIATTSTSTNAAGSSTVVVSTTTVGGGAGGAFATPAAGVGLAAIMAAVVAL